MISILLKFGSNLKNKYIYLSLIILFLQRNPLFNYFYGSIEVALFMKICEEGFNTNEETGEGSISYDEIENKLEMKFESAMIELE